MVYSDARTHWRSYYKNPFCFSLEARSTLSSKSGRRQDMKPGRRLHLFQNSILPLPLHPSVCLPLRMSVTVSFHYPNTGLLLIQRDQQIKITKGFCLSLAQHHQAQFPELISWVRLYIWRGLFNTDCVFMYLPKYGRFDNYLFTYMTSKSWF